MQYGITSLPPTVADAARLLALKRGHWQIENSLHYVKDVTLGEDRSLIHVGKDPSVMAMLRDLTLSLLHQNGCQKSPSGCASIAVIQNALLLSLLASVLRTHKPCTSGSGILTAVAKLAPAPFAKMGR